MWYVGIPLLKGETLKREWSHFRDK
jgi:hypothetical protein